MRAGVLMRAGAATVVLIALAPAPGCTTLVGDLLPDSDGGAGDLAAGRSDGSICRLAFAPPVNYPAGNDPSGIALLDVDRDGNIDLAVTDKAASQVLLLHGAGDGTFTRGAHFFAGGAGPVAIVADDFNQHDGIPDLAVALKAGSAVSVFIGTGGGFGAPVVYPTGGEAWDLASGDITGDDSADLITSNTTATSFSLLLNHKDGTFAPAVNLALPGGNLPYAIALADLDRDGHLDILAPCADCNGLNVLLGRGGGAFKPPARYPTGGYSNELGTGDVDHDGFADVALSNWRDHSVSVLRGHGDGTFGPPDTWPAGVNANGARLVDADGDGNVDLVTAGSGDGTFGVLVGHGDGTFADLVTIAVGNNPGALVSGDVNADGLPDFAMTNSGVVTVILNRSTCGPR